MRENKCEIRFICKDKKTCQYADLKDYGDGFVFCKHGGTYDDEGFCMSAIAQQNAMYHHYKRLGLNVEIAGNIHENQ